MSRVDEDAFDEQRLAAFSSRYRGRLAPADALRWARDPLAPSVDGSESPGLLLERRRQALYRGATDPAEAAAFRADAAAWEQALGAYAMLQATRPQTLSYALTDSPVGQLAWIVERFKDWTDSKDTPEDAVDRDAMLTNVMIYWLNGTAGSSARYYKSGNEGWGEPEPPSPVPTAIAVLPYDIGSPVRRVAEQNHEIVRWTEYERGGHFAAMEEPDLVVADLRESFRPYRR